MALSVMGEGGQKCYTATARGAAIPYDESVPSLPLAASVRARSAGIPAVALAFLLSPVATTPSAAQQREPRIEVHVLSGVYATEVDGGLLKPEIGAGVLVPLGSRWAALVDSTVGVPRLNEYMWEPGDPARLEAVFYMRNPHLSNEDEHWRRVTTIRPSIVRMWRRDRFSIYVGAGFGLESEHHRWRFQRINQVLDEEGNVVGRESEDDHLGTLVRAESFTTGDNWVHQKALIGRFGMLVNLAPRIVVRGGYSCLLSYLDEPLSGAIEASIGYRF